MTPEERTTLAEVSRSLRAVADSLSTTFSLANRPVDIGRAPDPKTFRSSLAADFGVLVGRLESASLLLWRLSQEQPQARPWLRLRAALARLARRMRPGRSGLDDGPRPD